MFNLIRPQIRKTHSLLYTTVRAFKVPDVKDPSMYTPEKIKERQAAIAAKLKEVKKQNEGVDAAFKAHDPSEFSFTKKASKLQ